MAGVTQGAAGDGPAEAVNLPAAHSEDRRHVALLRLPEAEPQGALRPPYGRGLLSAGDDREQRRPQSLRAAKAKAERSC